MKTSFFFSFFFLFFFMDSSNGLSKRKRTNEDEKYTQPARGSKSSLAMHA